MATNVFGHISLLEVLEAMAEHFGFGEPLPDILERKKDGEKILEPVWRVTLPPGVPIFIALGDGDCIDVYVDTNLAAEAGISKAEFGDRSGLYITGIATFYIEELAKKLELKNVSEIPEPVYVKARAINKFNDQQYCSLEVHMDPSNKSKPFSAKNVYNSAPF